MELTKERALERTPHPVEDQLELSIVMPCLNEAETIAARVEKGLGFLQREGVVGEVVVADNGSTDGSLRIARQLGARVVDVPTRGYGAALIAGISAARGCFVIMGDADDSYDFNALEPFLKNCAMARIWSWAIASKAASNPERCRRCIAISAIRY